MEILQVVGMGIITTFLILVLKEQKPIFATTLAIFFGVCVFIWLGDKVANVFTLLESLAVRAKIDGVFFVTILKIIGIAYIVEFGAQVTRDAGQGTIASKIELAGKVLIMVMAVPIITAIIDTVVKTLPM